LQQPDSIRRLIANARIAALRDAPRDSMVVVKTPSVRNIRADRYANETTRQRSERASDDRSRGRTHRAVA
jgi:hypothetical protein